MKKLLLAAVAVLFIAGIAYAGTHCDNCMMNIKDDSPYRVTVLLKDGSSKHVCSLFCASMEKERLGDEAVKLVVVDYNTGEEMDAKDAVWVEGSDAKRMMSDVSRVAFKDKASAEAFMKEHGGHIVSFDEAYQGSVNEWKGK